MQEIDWSDLRVVLSLARSGSASKAAQHLGVNVTTVTRRIARIEQRLGAQLFERSIGVFHSTAAGKKVIAAADRVELEVQSMEAAVSGADASAAGRVRITSVPILVNRVLVPALPRLLQTPPNCRWS